MKVALKNLNIYVVLVIDSTLLFISYFLAGYLKFDNYEQSQTDFFWQTVFAIISLKLAVFFYFRLQTGMWRYTGIYDLLNIIKASLVSFALIMVAMLYFYGHTVGGSFSKSVFILDLLISVTLITSFRVAIRLLYSRPGFLLHAISFYISKLTGGENSSQSGIEALIYDAGDRGEQLLRTLLSSRSAWGDDYNVIGLIDDNQNRKGVAIHGKPVLGSLDDLAELKSRFSIKELLVAALLEGQIMGQLSEKCKSLGITLRVMPTNFNNAHGSAGIDMLRKIEIEDLLFRDPVEVDYTSIERLLKGKSVLVTGAGGSIGSELTVQIASFNPRSLALLDKGENYLHQLEMRLGMERQANVRYYCANLTDKEKMRRLFEIEKPEYVFHAAAHKHVPMMERNRDEAILNNIGGMKIVADLADEFQVDRFTLVSTDKAVDPINIMGATKRVCELYLGKMEQKSKTRFMAMRFGNVLGSNGSVVPTFMNQIEKRLPVTVTHKDMERYFMTIPEAVTLILQAMALGEGGELFMLDMGRPVRIADLAEKMIKMAGFVPGRDIPIVYTGLRPGEKMTEVLTGKGEDVHKTGHPKINKVLGSYKPKDDISRLIDGWLSSCRARPEETAQEIIETLRGEKDNTQNVIHIGKAAG